MESQASPSQNPKSNFVIWIAVGVITLAIGIGIGLAVGKYSSSASSQIISYDDCVNAKGSIVQYSYPATCVTASGQRFAQPVSAPTATPTETTDPTVSQAPNGDLANWKTYTSSNEKFSFKYPSVLFTIDSDDQRLTFYLSEKEAREVLDCLEKKLGTIEKPCGQFMVLNIGVAKHPINYQYSLKNSLGNTDPSLVKPTSYLDAQNRNWLIEGPIEIEGGSNLTAEVEQNNSLYQIFIQVGAEGFSKYFGLKLSNSEYRKIVDQILSTFKFVE